MADRKGYQKRKKVVLTIENKIDICNRLENGEGRKAIMQEYGIASSTVYDIHKHKNEYQKFYSASDSTKVITQRKTLRKPKLEELDSILYEWFITKRSEGSPISGPIIKEKAKELYEKMELTEKCTFSDGWLAGFKSRHAIQKLVIVGEPKSSDSNSAKEYINSFAKLVEEHSLSPDQIYNAAETELLWRSLPDKTLANEKDAAEFKSNQDRLTVLCCANASGIHRVKLLVIGKDQHLCSLQNVQQLPVEYAVESNESMNQDIFRYWFLHTFVPSVKEHFVSVGLPESSKCLLLLDKWSAHPCELELSAGNIFVKYLPSNVAALIQPMHQGVIQNMKSSYRRDFLRKLVKCEGTLTTFQNSLEIKDAILTVASAWKLIKKETLRRAWQKLWPLELSDEGTSGFEENIADADEYDSREEIGDNSETVFAPAEVQKWLKTEEESTDFTYSMIEGDLINPFLKSESRNIPNETANKNVSWASAAEAYETLIKFAENTPCYSAEEIMQLHALHASFLQKRQEPLKQTDIRRFFKKVIQQK